jgi:KDO2-lipid IV(A) lauroyltransferase
VLRFLSFILGNLPKPLEKIVFELFYPIYLIKFNKEKKYIAMRLKKANLPIRPKDVYKNLFFNGLASLRFLKGKEKIGFENLPLAQNEINKGNPIIFASIHLGAFEILHRGLPVTSRINLVVSEFKNKKLDELLTSLRGRQNIKIVKDYELSKVLKNIIRNKEILAIMTDQSKHGGENFEILGAQVPLFLKLPVMANRMGASLVFFRAFRKNDSHIIRFEHVYPPQSEINKGEIAKMIESWILEYPEQWAWNYSNQAFSTFIPYRI